MVGRVTIGSTSQGSALLEVRRRKCVRMSPGSAATQRELSKCHPPVNDPKFIVSGRGYYLTNENRVHFCVPVGGTRGLFLSESIGWVLIWSVTV